VLLDPAVEHDILMIAREAVYNAVQHSHSGVVHLQVRYEDDRIRVVVADNGCGFDPAKALAAGGPHFGLVGMRERTERMGGRFEIRSSPGHGTELSVEVPVRPGEAEKLRIVMDS
jgi:signal transduction histidine kinase